MHKCNCSPPDERCPAQPQAVIAASPWPTPPAYLLSMEQNVPLASLGQLSWLCPLPAPAHLPSQASMRSWKVLGCLETAKNIGMLSALFSSQIRNTALHQLQERKWTLSQMKPGHQSRRGSIPLLREFTAATAGSLWKDKHGHVKTALHTRPPSVIHYFTYLKHRNFYWWTLRENWGVLPKWGWRWFIKLQGSCWQSTKGSSSIRE